MAAKDGDGGMRLSRATVALILAIAGPTAAAGIAQYRIGQLEAQRVDMEARLRAVERAVVRFETTTEAVEKQTDVIEGLRITLTRMAADQDRDRRDSRADPRTDDSRRRD